MKRKLSIIISCFCIIGILGFVYFVVDNFNNIETDINAYLENKYNQKFLINQDISNKNIEDCLCLYSFSPESNPQITFSAGIKKEENIFPFLFPAKRKVFFDTYFEASKSFIVSETIAEKQFVLNDYSDITDLTDSVYNCMNQINNKLENMGFETTKYTCSITVNVLVRQKLKEFHFYVLDKTTIHSSLSESFLEE